MIIISTYLIVFKIPFTSFTLETLLTFEIIIKILIRANFFFDKNDKITLKFKLSKSDYPISLVQDPNQQKEYQPTCLTLNYP